MAELVDLVEGAQVVVGDTQAAAGEIGYEVLCRRHHIRRMTRAHSMSQSAPAS